MRIFIVGAGEVGVHIASELAREGRHDLVVIERDSTKVAELQSSLDILAIVGDGCNPELLEARGVSKADLFFAVSNDDAVNMLAALTARSLGAGRCIVRIGRTYLGSNPLLARDENILPLFPERLVAEEVLALTRVPGASKARFFAEGRLVLVQVRPSPEADIYGRPLREMRGPEGWILTGLHRADGTFIPRGDTVLRRGDPIYAVGRTETVSAFLDSLGVTSRPVRRVVIAGAGHVGQWLTRLLVEQKVQVSVIQRGKERAFDLAVAVPEALVLRGDVRDPDILREAGVEQADFFIAATQEDEANLLSALLARELGAKAVIALYNRAEFLDLLRAVRIDLPLSPRLMVAGTILRMVHRREIVSLDIVAGGDAEVVEFEVPQRCRVLGKPLADLHIPRTAIVGAVARGAELFVPGGSFEFQSGDRALVFTLTEALPALEKMFRAR